MREGLTITGLILLLFGLFFTAITGGFGIVLGGPVALLGFVLLIIGSFSSEEETITVRQKQTDNTTIKSRRYCDECGRTIPSDAKICPYCGKKFGEIAKSIQKEKQTAEMKTCPSCDFVNKSNSKFCKKCGAELDE